MVLLTLFGWLRSFVARCAYFNVTLNDWSSEGCNVTLETDDYTICTCNHLTDFAMFLPPNNFAKLGTVPPQITNETFAGLVVGGILVTTYTSTMLMVRYITCPSAYWTLRKWIGKLPLLRITKEHVASTQLVRGCRPRLIVSRGAVPVVMVVVVV